MNELNPPAFPQQCADALDVGMVHEGMSLRDWFAGQALVGLLADSSQRRVAEACEEDRDFRRLIPVRKAETVNIQIAWGCYALADAMLAERAKP